MAAIPKECYALFEELAEKRKASKISFKEMLTAMTEKKHWSEVNWKKIRQKKRVEVSKSPIVLVCHKQQTIEQSPGYSVDELQALVKKGTCILIATTVAERYEYPLITT